MKKTLDILHLEDNQIDAELVKEILDMEQINAKIICVDNREDFLEQINENKFDIILADYSLPSFDGLTALKVVKEKNIDTPFILVSAVLGEELAIEALQSGATDYVLKSRPERLVPAIKRALREKEELSKRIRLEKEITELEEMYSKIAERVRGFLRMELPSGKYSLVDKFIEELSGYPVEEWQETPNFIATIIHPDFQEYYDEQFEQFQKGFVPKMLEYKVVRKDGEERWWLQFNIGAYDIEGKLVSISMVIIDNTETKESNIKYQNLFENASVGMYRSNIKTGEIIEANSKMAEIFGYESVDTFKGMSAKDFYFSDRDRELFVKELLDKGSFVGKEVLLKSREGKKIYALISASAYPKEGYIEGVIVDISELKQAQEELAHRERMLERIFEHTGSTTIIVETDTTISKSNQQLVELTGYSKEEVEGKMKWTEFVHPDDRAKMIAYHKARRDITKAAQVPKNYEFKLIAKDGTVIPSYLTVGFIPETTQSVASVIDISQRKAAEKALRRERQAFQIIAEAAIQPVETQSLCEQVVEGLIRTLNFEMGTVRFYNDDDRTLEPVVVVGFDEEEKQLIVTKSIDNPEFASSIVARTKTSIFAPNVAEDKFLTKILPSFNLPGIKAFISWPLVSSKQELIGTIQLIAREPKIFREEDRIFFESVAGMFAAILERKLAEEALIESEEKYRTLIDSLPRKMAVIIIQDNKIVFSSPAGSEKMISEPIDKILNKSPLSFVEEEERDRIKKYMELRIENSDVVPRNYETTLVDFEGNQFPAEIYATKTIYEGETAIQAVISDISERKKTEQQRRLLSNIVDNSKEVVISADENGKIIYANPPVKDVFGWTPDEIIGKHISILDPPTRGTLQDKTFSSALKGENQTIETIRRHKNGSLVPVVMTVSSFKDEETEKITTSAIIVDISDIKQLEDTLKDRSYQLEVLNKVISAGISARNLNELLDFTLSTVLTSLDFRGGAIYLVNEEKTKAVLKRSLGMSSSFIDQGKELDINSGVFKKIFGEGKSLKSDNFLRKSEDHKQFGIHTLLIVPFFSKQKVIGAIFLTTKEERVFSEEELDLLDGIGREIGTAIAKILAEEESHIYEKNLQTIFNTLDHSFIIIDRLSGKIIKTNNTFAQKLGYTIKQLLQFPISDLCALTEAKLMKTFEQISPEKHKKISFPFKTKKEDIIHIDFKIYSAQLGEKDVFIAISTEAN